MRNTHPLIMAVGITPFCFGLKANFQVLAIEFYVVTGPDTLVSAWVTDSDGNYYTVDVTIIYGL